MRYAFTSKYEKGIFVWNLRTSTWKLCLEPLCTYVELVDLHLKLLCGTFEALCEPFLVSGAFIWNLHVDPIFHLCGSFKCGTIACHWVRSNSGEPFSGTFILNLYVELACGTIVWKLCVEPLFGNLQNQNVEPCGTCGNILWNHFVEESLTFYVEPCKTWCEVSGRRNKPPRSFIGRTPSFPSCWVNQKKHSLKSLGKKSVKKSKTLKKSPKSSHI